jgi:hypothetical protein
MCVSAIKGIGKTLFFWNRFMFINYLFIFYNILIYVFFLKTLTILQINNLIISVGNYNKFKLKNN